MLKPAAIVGQVILYGAFAAFIGYFATSPTYHQIPDDVALIKLSISHLGDRECRKRTPEELAKMPPNMRAPMDCPRERSDIRLEVDLDGSRFPHRAAPHRPLQGRRVDGLQTLRAESRQAPGGRQDERQAHQTRLQLQQGSGGSPSSLGR
jgi:hypothetical protein